MRKLNLEENNDNEVYEQVIEILAPQFKEASWELVLIQDVTKYEKMVTVIELNEHDDTTLTLRFIVDLRKLD